MHTITELRSADDPSVNWVEERPLGLRGIAETRYVRRADDYLIAYLSSQTGCAKACRFCHLTQTGQTGADDLPVRHILDRAERVLTHYDRLVAEGGAEAREVHFNFMARGEVLSNTGLLDRADELLLGLVERARRRALVPSIKLSTIMPRDIADRDLTRTLGAVPVDFYYSLYSLRPEFRRRWMPNAIDPAEAFAILADYQRTLRTIPVLHWAFIAGENDREQDAFEIAEAVRASGLRCDINIVRYNAHSERVGSEPEIRVIARNMGILADELPGARVRMVDRVGYDVKASCGMFIGGRAGG